MTEWPQSIVYSYGQALERLPPRARAKLGRLRGHGQRHRGLGNARWMGADRDRREEPMPRVARRRNYARQCHSATTTELDQELTAAARQHASKLQVRAWPAATPPAPATSRFSSRLRGFVQTLCSAPPSCRRRRPRCPKFHGGRAKTRTC